MIFPCPNATPPCDGSENPLTNFSSESADPPIRLGYSTGTSPTSSFQYYGGAGPVPGPPSGPGPANPPSAQNLSNADTGTGGEPPPLGSTWDNPYVTTFVEVTDPTINPADEAGNENVEQLTGTGGVDTGGYTNPNGTRAQVFVNHPQTCTIACSDGSPFSYTVPVGTFRALSQAAADRSAYSLACKRAYINRVCLSNINPIACTGVVYDQTILADTNSPLVWEVIGGSIPSWITTSVGDKSFRLTGTPSVSDVGTTIFTVFAQDLFGFSMTKDFTIQVAECNTPCLVTTSTMTAFDQGQPYSQQIAVTGGTPPYSFSLVEGSLPQGLSMSTSGLISGTAALVNGNLDQTFTVEVADSSDPVKTCDGTITIPVLDYATFPPGKKWRIASYNGLIFDVSCLAPVISAFTWNGQFDNLFGSANFKWITGIGLLNPADLNSAVTPALNSGVVIASPEWLITFFDTGFLARSAWFGKKIGSNAGVKLDSPAGVYTIDPAGAALAGITLCSNTPATVTIEEY